MRALLNEKDPPERATAPVGSLNEAAFPASFLPQSNPTTRTEQAVARPLVSPAVVAVRMDPRNAHFQVVTMVPGEGGFRPLVTFLDRAAAMRAGIEHARKTGSRFRGRVS